MGQQSLGLPARSADTSDATVLKAAAGKFHEACSSSYSQLSAEHKGLTV